jgi:uncharacterized protein YkwD
MKRRLVVMGLLVVSTLALLAGCPQQVQSVPQTPWSGQIGGTGGGGGGDSGDVGPQVPDSSSDRPDSSADASPDTSTPNPEPAIVGGDVSGTTASADELTVEYPECQEPADGAFWRSEILRLVNQERQAQGVSPVTLNDTLADEAAEYACEMIHYDFFGHTNPTTGSTLTDRAAEVHYDFWIIGENLAAGQRSPAQVMAEWMDSPCHRENIMNPAFTELGVAVRVGGDYGFYWVQEFGRPFSAQPYGGPPYADPECTRE